MLQEPQREILGRRRVSQDQTSDGLPRDPNIFKFGTFPYHCHILQHEDGGMMGTIQVSSKVHKIKPDQARAAPQLPARRFVEASRPAPKTGDVLLGGFWDRNHRYLGYPGILG